MPHSGVDDIYRIRQAIYRVFAAMDRIHESALLANRPNDHAAGALDRTQEAIGGAFGPMDPSWDGLAHSWEVSDLTCGAIDRSCGAIDRSWWWPVCSPFLH